MAEIKRVTLHPLNPDGTIDENVNLYPKTLIDGIVDREGEEIEVATKESLDNFKISVDESIEQLDSELSGEISDLNINKQDKLKSGENIKTINGIPVIGPGDIEVTTEYSFNEYYTLDEIYKLVGTKSFFYNVGGDGGNIANLILTGTNELDENLYSVYMWSNEGIKHLEDVTGSSYIATLHYDFIHYVTTENFQEKLENSELIKELQQDTEKLDDRVTNIEKQTLVYNYFYSSDSDLYLPREDTTFNLLEVSSKDSTLNWINNCYITIAPGEEPFAYYATAEGEIVKNIGSVFSIQEPIYLYQTGFEEDIATTKYAYDTLDLTNKNVVRYCYPITFRELFSMFSPSDFTWSGSSGNGRLSIRHTTLAEKGIYTENGFTIKYTRNIGLSYKGISSINFAIDNLLSIEGITNKATAISVLTGDDYADVKLIFKRTEPVEELIDINLLLPSIECDGIKSIMIHCESDNFCLKASYLSLYSLVYSKDQSDAKFQTIAGYVEQYNANEHIVKIGDLEDSNKIISSTALYSRLSEMGWPKVASAFCVEPEEGQEYEGELIPEFTHDTLFINSFDGTNYGYIVLSNKNMYWFRVDTRTGILTLESMLEKEEIKNLMDSENNSLVQVSHFNEGLTWSSDDESVATVNQEGKITAVGAGTAVISVIDEDGRTAECQVTVTTPKRQLSSRKGLLRGVAPQGTQYRLVSDVSSLNEGDSIIIAAMKSSDSSWYALSTIQNSNNRAVAAISAPTDDIITITGSDVEEITLESTGQQQEFNLSVSGGYLYAASNSNNYLKTRSDVGSDGNANWLLDIVNNEASIVAQGNYTRNVLRAYLSGSSPVFSCYASASNVPVRIYKKVEGPEPPKSVAITGTSGTLTVGTSIQLSALVIPVTASQEVTWSTSDSSIISVDSTGYITAEGIVGESADITATCVADTSISATVTIALTEVPTIITAVNVTPSTVSGLTYGETAQLSAEVIGTGPGVTQDVTWTSGDEEMATVDNAGLVTIGNKPGNVVIVATSDVDPNISGSSTVIVPQAIVESIEIDSETPTELTIGLDYLINYNIYPSYAYDKSVTWESSDNTKATVSNGVVSALEVTTEPIVITISALDGSGVSDSISINIVEPLGRLYLDIEELHLKVGETYKLICSDKPFNIATGRTSAAFGSGNDVEHEDSFALGSHLASTADNQTLVGKYNDTSSTAIFQVGAGNGHGEFNAFEVAASGKVKAGTATQSSDSANTLVTKGFADVTYVAKTRVSSILTSDWTNSSVTLSLSPVVIGPADVLFVTPTDDCAQEYYDCGIQRTISQDGTSITLSAVTIPENTITVQLIYLKGQGF